MATQTVLLTKFFKQAGSDIAHMAYDGVTFDHYLQWKDAFIKKAGEVLSPRSLGLLRNMISNAWKSHTQFNIAFCYVKDDTIYRTHINPVKGVNHTTGELHDLGSMTCKDWDQLGAISIWCHTGTIFAINRTPVRVNPLDSETTRLSNDEFSAILDRIQGTI